MGVGWEAGRVFGATGEGEMKNPRKNLDGVACASMIFWVFFSRDARVGRRWGMRDLVARGEEAGWVAGEKATVAGGKKTCRK